MSLMSLGIEGSSKNEKLDLLLSVLTAENPNEPVFIGDLIENGHRIFWRDNMFRLFFYRKCLACLRLKVVYFTSCLQPFFL